MLMIHYRRIAMGPERSYTVTTKHCRKFSNHYTFVLFVLDEHKMGYTIVEESIIQ